MSGQQAPSFSSQSLDAAKAQLERWGIAVDTPLKERTAAFTEALCRWNEQRKYGVEDAVHSGTRVRLLDQMQDGNFDAARMNCAETGANLLLLAHAMGRGREARLLRYNWGMASDHLGLVLLDDEREPTLIDPLGNRYGRVKLSKHGVFFCPEDVPRPTKIFKGSWSLLDERDLVHHVRYLNSPLGFFPYYENGQIIRTDADGYPRFEYHIQTNGEDVTFRIVCDDVLPDRYTFERTMQQYADHTIERTVEYLHADVGFAQIKDPVFSLDDRNQASLLLEKRYDKKTTPIWLGACHLRKREILQEHTSVEARAASVFWHQWSQKWNEVQDIFCKKILRENARKQNLLAAQATLNPEDQKALAHLKYEHTHVGNTVRLNRRLRTMHADEKQRALGARAVGDLFVLRDFKREDLQNARALWNDNIEDACAQYITTRRAMFAKDTRAFLTSPVYATLLEQYREALEIKRVAHGLLNT